MRLHELISEHKANKRSKVDDLNFIIPGEPVQMFGQTFEDMDDCLKYCDVNDIPYTKEKGCFGFDTYNFPAA